VFEFCRLWLVVVACAMAFAGSFLAIAIHTRVFSLLNALIDRAFWRSAPDEATRHFQQWTYSVLLATMAGWGACMAVLVFNGFPTRQLWVWWSVAAGIAIWFPIDTARSLYHRVWANAAGNVLLLLAFGVPLIATFGEFR
jgi:hypothetical protein